MPRYRTVLNVIHLLARRDRTGSLACGTRTGESVREVSDWNPVTTSPEVGQAWRRRLSRASCVKRICSSGQDFSRRSLEKRTITRIDWADAILHSTSVVNRACIVVTEPARASAVIDVIIRTDLASNINDRAAPNVFSGCGRAGGKGDGEECRREYPHEWPSNPPILARRMCLYLIPRSTEGSRQRLS